MKHFFKKLFVTLAIFTSVFAVQGSPAAFAAGGDVDFSCRYMLGLTSWDCGIEKIGGITNEETLKNSIWIIASNVLADLTVIAAYLVLGYVIYGGYLYMFASGDSGKAAGGKKTLTNAFIGLAIVMLSNIILNAIRIALIGNQSLANCTVEGGCGVSADAMVSNIIGWVIGISGVVAAVFLVVGGVGYLTSAGDSSKLQKAKSTILYALIGLVIVGLAQVITAFVTSAIRDAKQASLNNQIAITKEITHEN